MSSYEYNQLLKFLYFEGYVDSYEEAENLIEEMSDEEFEELLERRYGRDEPLPGSGKTPRQKMKKKRDQHSARVALGNPALGRSPRNDPERDSYRDRASMMDRVAASQDRGEEPRDDEGRKNLIKAARRPRASYERQDNRPGGLRAGNTKAGGHRTLVRKEETEIQNEAKQEFPTDKVKKQSAKHMRNFLTRPNSAIGQRSKQKSKKMDAIRSTVEVGDDPRKTMHGQDLRKIREEFEAIIEFLFVEGYADTIENAELMAECISEEWVNDIIEARRSEREDKGSPESALEYPGRKTKKERGEMGGRHWQSGGEGGSRTERGKKKTEPESQAQRLRGLSTYPEKPGKYARMQSIRRGSEMGSRFD